MSGSYLCLFRSYLLFSSTEHELKSNSPYLKTFSHSSKGALRRGTPLKMETKRMRGGGGSNHAAGSARFIKVEWIWYHSNRYRLLEQIFP